MNLPDTTPLDGRLPKRIALLEKLGYNLWWSWSQTARDLFKAIDEPHWYFYNQNPILLIKHLNSEQISTILSSPEILKAYDHTLKLFEQYHNRSTKWFERTYPGYPENSIAYFSAEFGLHQSLPIYSGGLGILSGDHMKASSDLGLPIVGIGFMYPQGYFIQKLPAHGWQEAVYENLDFENVPLLPLTNDDGSQFILRIPLENTTIGLRIWHVRVGLVNLYLMDSDIPENDPWHRNLTARLYGGDTELRLKQEYILGIGGVRLLRALGLNPKVWHLNEGHSSFLIVERLRELIASGHTFEEARELVRKTTIFTTHTPVPAGHDTFSVERITSFFDSFIKEMKITPEEFISLGVNPHASADEKRRFNMTILGLLHSRFRNGVSRLNGEVTRKMWHPLWPDKSLDQVPIDHITNGVHLKTWLASRWRRLFDKYLPSNWRDDPSNPEIWKHIDDIPDDEFWHVHYRLRLKLMRFIRETCRLHRRHKEWDAEKVLASGSFLDPEALTIGFARRFATYKRASLILHDIERLKSLLHDSYRPIQIIFAGKAHPRDDPGKHLLQQIYQLANDPEIAGRIAFIENYDMQIARYMVQGVDVWLNTPLKPLEASGTSGMKAAMNGVPNLSILDGWWAEGYTGANGWAISPHSSNEGLSREEIDARDASHLYDLLEFEVAPLFYKRGSDDLPHGWIKVAKEAIKTSAARFSAIRMVKDYTNKYYIPILSST